MLDRNQILHGDCLDLIKQVADDSIDLVVTSPPYANQRKRTYDGKSADEYVPWFLTLSADLLAKLKPSGSFVLNIKENVVDGERSPYVLKLVLALQEQGWLWTETYIWHKKNAIPGKWPNRLRDGWEYCFHFTKQRKFKMLQEAVKVPIGDWAEPRMKSLTPTDHQRKPSATGSGFGRMRANWLGRDTVFPDNVVVAEDDEWRAALTDMVHTGIVQQCSPEEIAERVLGLFEGMASNVLYASAECRNSQHSAAFPEKLPAFFIKLFSEPGDLVLDPFLGSGTTAKVARDLGRDFLGFEMKEAYVEVALGRLGLHL